MSRLLAAAGAALLVTSMAVPVAAQEADAAPVVISVGCDAFQAEPAQSGSVDVITGSTVVVMLCSNPTTGYSWSAPASTDEAVALVSGWGRMPAMSDMAGAPGAQQLTIQALAAGTTVLSTSYDQPWDGGEKGTWTAELTLNVHDGVEVSIGCDAFASSPNAVQAVGISAGQAVVLHVCANPTTGFSWGDAVSSDPAVASVGAWAYEAPEPGMMGASGTSHVVVVGEAAGTATITSSYDQPWDGGTKGAWTLELTLTVS
jgi:hypothetical protein